MGERQGSAERRGERQGSFQLPGDLVFNQINLKLNLVPFNGYCCNKKIKMLQRWVSKLRPFTLSSSSSSSSLPHRALLHSSPHLQNPVSHSPPHSPHPSNNCTETSNPSKVAIPHSLFFESKKIYFEQGEEVKEAYTHYFQGEEDQDQILFGLKQFATTMASGSIDSAATIASGSIDSAAIGGTMQNDIDMTKMFESLKLLKNSKV